MLLRAVTFSSEAGVRTREMDGFPRRSCARAGQGLLQGDTGAQADSRAKGEAEPGGANRLGGLSGDADLGGAHGRHHGAVGVHRRAARGLPARRVVGRQF